MAVAVALPFRHLLNIMKSLLPFLFLLTDWHLILAQTTLSISYPVSPDTTDTGLGIVQMEDGYLIGCGSVNRLNGLEYAGLLKIDWDANLLWNKSYYWEPYQPDIAFNDPVAIIDDSVYMACQTDSDSSNLNYQLFRLNMSGDTIWSKTYFEDFRDVNIGVISLLDTNLLMYGNMGTTDVLGVARLIKTEKTGNVIWEKTYGSEFGRSIPHSVSELPDGSLLMSSNICHYGSNCFLNEYPALSKIGKEGNLLWTKTYHKSESAVLALSVPLDEDRIALAWTRDTFNSDLDPNPPILFFLDSLGNMEYEYEGFKRSGNYYLTKLRKCSNGDILGVGQTYDFSDTVALGGWLFRMTQAGELVWERRILDLRYPDLYGYFYDAMETPDGGFIAVGNILVNGGSGSEVWIVKLDENGCLEPGCTGDSIYITPTKEILKDGVAYFEIGPNPAKDYFNVQISDELNLSATRLGILDLSGRELTNLKIESPLQQVNTSSLNNGMYIVRLIHNERPIATKKLVIIH